MAKLSRQDIREPRPNCDVCSQELTYAEYLFCDGRCVFHAEGGLTAIKNLSLWSYIDLLMGDLKIVRAKLKMKSKGQTAIDYQATVNTIAEDLRFIDNSKDIHKLIKAMKAHTGQWIPT